MSLSSKSSRLLDEARKGSIKRKSPVDLVGYLINKAQGLFTEEKSTILNKIVQGSYIKYQESLGLDLNQARQSWVVASGNNFEQFIRNLINDHLNKEGIIAVKGDILKNKDNAREMVKFLTLKASRRCTQKNTRVWPDSDIVAITKEKSGKLKAFALLNCKTSDHSRNDAVLFWALALRDNGIKYCLVTQDLDKKFVKGDENASKLRKKTEAYLDRVFSTHPQTAECSQIVKLDFSKEGGLNKFFNDLRNWRQEVVPLFTDESLTLECLV